MGPLPALPSLELYHPDPQPYLVQESPQLLNVLNAGEAQFGRRESEPLSAAPENIAGQPLVAFFYNNHNAHQTYRKELKDFVASYDEILVEGLPNGRPLHTFQAVADGAMTPAQALRAVPERGEPMDQAVLEALYKSGKKVLPEPIFKRKFRQLRRTVDKKLHPKASEALGGAFESFIMDGEAKQAARRLDRARLRRFHLVGRPQRLRLRRRQPRHGRAAGFLDDRISHPENILCYLETAAS